MRERARGDTYFYAVIGTIAFSMLLYQVLLTRVSALRLLFHFSFLAISNCLLGIGAAGTLITLMRRRWEARARAIIARFSLLYLASLAIAYAFILRLPLPSALRLADPGHFVLFSVFNLTTALPFFFSGGVIGMILTFHSDRVNRAYACDLVGASAGCLVCPFLLRAFGAGGTLLIVAMTGLFAWAVAAAPGRRRQTALLAVTLAVLLAALTPSFDKLFPVPGKGDLQFTATRTINVSDVTEFSRWSTGSRIDVVPVSTDSRFIFGRGSAAREIPLPPEKFILQDGSAGTFIVNFSDEPEALRSIDLSLYSATFQMKERAKALIIGVGGGNDVWAAMRANARSVRGVELNRPIIDLHHGKLAEYTRAWNDDARVRLVHGEGRSELMRDTDRYDVIQMSGIDTWTALTSGAYVLAENYLYTTEALVDLLEHLEPGGVLQITRFAATDEVLRLLSNINAAMQSAGLTDMPASVICLRDEIDVLVAFLVKKGPFTEDEIERTARFAQQAGLEVIYLPGRTQPTRQNPPAAFILTPLKDRFIELFPRDISPTTDDRPYFFNFARWSRFWEEPARRTAIAQGNPRFLLIQLALSTVLAVGLIVLPLILSKHRRFDRHHAGRFFVYFLGLGIGFIAIEVSLIQKLTLFLGHPVHSITVTLFCVLLFAGLGSLASARWFERSRRREWIVPAAIAATLAAFVVVAPHVIEATGRFSLAGRASVTAALLAPIAFLLGVPLAHGVRVLRRLNPSMIPWAWAVNGCFTVIGSILTVIASMNFGFNAVLLGAGAIYILAFTALPREQK